MDSSVLSSSDWVRKPFFGTPKPHRSCMLQRHATLMAGQPGPPLTYPLGKKGLIAGLIKGIQWLISPDHKALFLREVR